MNMLVEQGYKIKALVISQAPTRSRQSKELAVVQTAKRHGISIINVSEAKDIASLLQHIDAQIGVLSAFGQIVPKTVINLFPSGIVNIHPSLLPKYRGSSPIEQAILDGVDTTGVSLMDLNEHMDTGPIYTQSELQLNKTESKAELTNSLTELGAKLLKDHLPEIINGELTALAQDHDQASYTARIKKEDGQIDWNKSAERLNKEVRAYQGWPGSTTTLAGTSLKILEAQNINEQGPAGEHFKIGKSSFGVYAQEGALQIDRLQPVGKKPMTGGDFINGYELFA